MKLQTFLMKLLYLRLISRWKLIMPGVHSVLNFHSRVECCMSLLFHYSQPDLAEIMVGKIREQK